MIPFIKTNYSSVCLIHDWNHIKSELESNHKITDYNWYAEVTIEISDNDFVFDRIKNRMDKKDYPWWKIWNDSNSEMTSNLTIGISGIDLHQVIANLISAIGEARHIVCVTTDLSNTIGRSRITRSNEHFIIYNIHDPNFLYQHSWRNPEDEKCTDIYLTQHPIVYNRLVKGIY